MSNAPTTEAPQLSTARAVVRSTREPQPATAGRYLALLRERFRAGDLAAGAVALAGVLLFAADLALAGAGLPGARVFAVTAGAIGAIGACAVIVGLRACARPASLTDWRAAVLCAWMMLPLAFLAPGPLALALTAIDVRNVRDMDGLPRNRRSVPRRG
ncbi:hypothetical protein ACFWY6_01285 [Streptomyces sp. NPDC059037]|uniref:hypothetical protein n=1 Tax=Streptomyces sp. NPDC059037 TaxID=3346710 RepID=UPI00369381DA